MLQCGEGLRFPYVDRYWWPFGSREWPFECFYVSPFALYTTALEPDDFGSFESLGSTHKQLTFSEFLGGSYEADVSDKFVEYLQLCFRELLFHYNW